MLLVIEDSTDYPWSYFLIEKSKLKHVMLAQIKHLKTKYGVQVLYLHCNNAGKNVDFERVCKQEGIGMEFEYIAPGTPQQNGCVE